ncbi:alpha-mannosidase 2 [Bradysia coprophila]|uniref:alpha-mannosidase 2 n=1 Tax=Bradysia coprophila TaxID=38358 RepID=UPI00187DD672|nr:alpha-mannosidase 2 [Bradysia coprophila]
MTFKVFRRGSARCFGLLAAFITILLCLYYISFGQPASKDFRKRPIESPHARKFIDQSQRVKDNSLNVSSYADGSSSNWERCTALTQRSTKITTDDEYSSFDFQPEWMKTKEYWDKTFETRYEQVKNNDATPPLKIIVVPHSHNDPGWLKTFVNYFQSDSRQILNLIITKMQEYTDMTFIWSEISFLQLWWDQAHPTKQRALKQLIQSGRFEITTGGWVMTDEANVHLYAMLDQLIEGHQWIKANLNYTPVTGWSIDPFGHGSTVPYLLSAAGFEGTIIQRIHYAWKQWFAKHQYGDFMWEPYWSNSDEHGVQSLLTHNMPFDIYSIKHSCGPHPFVCLNFDFRKIPGEYTEYSIKAEFITDENIEAKATLLMDQYSRTASLFPHNVALIPVGDDFRYNKEKEVEQQYTNYKRLIDYINSHKWKYKAEISFGLPKDYFRAIRERYEQFPSLKGDFFVYSDIFTEGRPAYWSGYFSTRPMYKILSRELENQLRSLEILFTIAFNSARQSKNLNALRVYEKNYEKIILARRNLALFQHHDAITGTSKAIVMRDYGIRLFESIQDIVKLQESCIEYLIQKQPTSHHGFVLSEMERESFNKLSRKLPIYLAKNSTSKFVVYNSGSQDRLEVITIRTVSPNVEIWNDGVKMEIQVNPVWNITENVHKYTAEEPVNLIKVSDKQFEILFLASLPALSLSTFTIRYTEDYKTRMATIYCNECKDETVNLFEIRNKQPGDIQLENYKMRLLFDEQSGFLKTVTKKNMGKPIQCAIKFAAYRSAQFHSGAYLFKTDPEHHDTERNVFEQYADMKIVISSGPIASDVTVIYYPFLAHTVRIYNTKTDIDNAIYVENDIDFEPPPKNRETELFMRFTTDIENGENPIFYTDQNGFQYQKRVKVKSIGIEGNYFPITTAAFIQDEKTRLTVLTNHAQGAASFEPGHLEVMVDRRTLYDDYRGMGEGVVDSRQTRHKFWILIEHFQPAEDKSTEQNEYQVPSLFANHLSNIHIYPSNTYFIDSQDFTSLQLSNHVQLIDHKFPCDLHLLTLRTLTEEELPLFPSRSALMVLHRQAYSCKFADNVHSKQCKKQAFTKNIFNHLHIESIASTTLTGLKTNAVVKNFSSIYVKPMDIRTFNLTFEY